MKSKVINSKNNQDKKRERIMKKLLLEYRNLLVESNPETIAAVFLKADLIERTDAVLKS